MSTIQIQFYGEKFDFLLHTKILLFIETKSHCSNFAFVVIKNDFKNGFKFTISFENQKQQ